MRCLWILIAITCACHRPPARPSAATPSDDAELIAKAVLESFVRDPSTMPDAGLLEARFVLAHTDDQPPRTIRDGALPEGEHFLLRTAQQLQAEADRAGKPTAFIRFRTIEITGEQAHVVHGVDILLPKQSTEIKMCCCAVKRPWQKTGGRWAPTKGANTISICT